MTEVKNEEEVEKMFEVVDGKVEEVVEEKPKSKEIKSIEIEKFDFWLGEIVSLFCFYTLRQTNFFSNR